MHVNPKLAAQRLPDVVAEAFDGDQNPVCVTGPFEELGILVVRVGTDVGLKLPTGSANTLLNLPSDNPANQRSI
ncbi:hypothetical protein JQ626_06995 [Bradyrhizobium diazoefficiens]|jgi:hypothetical protein|nr:hypothetical protein [Bradyrhizobium diazoefficiens]MBR1007481.1 hypothetical protein [Bradyrhizobium diazoefficiens]MBR1056970.1 hypothetical protein [Bradyrhizobium diazoefficiens]